MKLILENRSLRMRDVFTSEIQFIAFFAHFFVRRKKWFELNFSNPVQKSIKPYISVFY